MTEEELIEIVERNEQITMFKEKDKFGILITDHNYSVSFSYLKYSKSQAINLINREIRLFNSRPGFRIVKKIK